MVFLGDDWYNFEEPNFWNVSNKIYQTIGAQLFEITNNVSDIKIMGGYNNAEIEVNEQCRKDEKWIVSQNLKN
jgi:hypothetical protein